MTSPATGSAQLQPSTALSSRPTSRTADSRLHSIVCAESDTTALERLALQGAADCRARRAGPRPPDPPSPPLPYAGTVAGEDVLALAGPHDGAAGARPAGLGQLTVRGGHLPWHRHPRAVHLSSIHQHPAAAACTAPPAGVVCACAPGTATDAAASPVPTPTAQRRSRPRAALRTLRSAQDGGPRTVERRPRRATAALHRRRDRPYTDWHGNHPNGPVTEPKWSQPRSRPHHDTLAHAVDGALDRHEGRLRCVDDRTRTGDDRARAGALRSSGPAGAGGARSEQDPCTRPSTPGALP